MGVFFSNGNHFQSEIGNRIDAGVGQLLCSTDFVFCLEVLQVIDVSSFDFKCGTALSCVSQTFR